MGLMNREQWRHRPGEQDTVGEGEAETDWKNTIETYTPLLAKWINWRFAARHRALKPGALWQARGWGEVGGGFTREGSYVYLWLTHGDVWQKPIQHCKAIILQLKTNEMILKRLCLKVIIMAYWVEMEAQRIGKRLLQWIIRPGVKWVDSRYNFDI